MEIEDWMRTISKEFGTEGFRFEVSIGRDNEVGLVLNINPINSNIGDTKIIEIIGNNIIRFE